jgi:hypothetical protein
MYDTILSSGDVNTDIVRIIECELAGEVLGQCQTSTPQTSLRLGRPLEGTLVLRPSISSHDLAIDAFAHCYLWLLTPLSEL